MNTSPTLGRFCACRCGLLASDADGYRAGHKDRKRRKGFAQIPEEASQRIVDLWNEGMSRAEIGREIGLTHITVTRRLVRAGIDPTNRVRRMEDHHHWRGGRSFSDKGYVMVKVSPNDAMASMRNQSGRVPEHRLVVARDIGRPLLSSETVHHKNGDRADNDLDNLELWSGDHGAGVRVPDLVGAALETLQMYAPRYLQPQHRAPQMRLEAA